MRYFFSILIFISANYAMAKTAQAVNCGEPVDHFMMEALTRSPEQGGLSGTTEEVGAIAHNYVTSGSFGDIVGKKAVVLKPYRIAAILKSDRAVCAIYTGQVVKAKVLTADDINNY